MLIKVLFAAATAAVAFAGVLYAVDKTATRIVEENQDLPEEERLSDDELEESLMSEFIEDVKSNRFVKFVTAILVDVCDYVTTLYDYRVKAALMIIALASFKLPIIPKEANRIAWAILGQELLWKMYVHAREAGRA